MEKFIQVTGVAAPFPLVNVDTDAIIPARYLKAIGRTGFGKALFSNMRYNEDGSEKADFVLNQTAYREAKVLITGENFGCGSSREHAPWALADFGIRCIIGTSFADIFYNNCFKNSILPIILPKAQVDMLMADAENGANATFTVDLESQTITRPGGDSLSFEVDPFRKHCLLSGLDDIGLTLQKADHISSFEAQDAVRRPWMAKAGTV